METQKYILITGASCGLGKDLAIECAHRGRNLLITSLHGENIQGVGKKIADQYHVDVVTFEADLTKPDEIRNLASIISRKYEVNMLINNAGLGGATPFLEASPEYIEEMVLLNTYALVMLTRLLLPNLKRQRKAYILNIASMAAFLPMPYKTVYPASKAFVYSFSRGLDVELKGTGVSVSVAHPGGMKTNPDVSLRIEKQNWFVNKTTLSSEKVAQICIRQLLNRKKLIIPGIFNKMSWLLLKIIPLRLSLSFLHGLLKRESKGKKRKVQVA